MTPEETARLGYTRHRPTAERTQGGLLRTFVANLIFRWNERKARRRAQRDGTGLAVVAHIERWRR